MISVIVPIYNVERYLPNCIDSLLNNTYGDIELICVNDGSPDACGEILEHYAQVDSRVRVVNKANKGVSSARNAGLAVAKGEWIAFVDADDAVNCRYFESLVDAWERDGRKADVVACGQLWHGMGELPDYGIRECMENEPRAQDWREIRNNMMAWAFLWGKIYRRELLANERIPEQLTFSEDTYFNLRILSKSTNLRLIVAPAAKYLYRNNPASAYHTLPPEKMLEAYTLLLHDCQSFPSHGGRSVSMEIVARHAFSISLAKTGRETRKASRKLMREALSAWRREGFISKGNCIAWFKFCLYCVFPSMAKVGKIIHDIGKRARK